MRVLSRLVRLGRQRRWWVRPHRPWGTRHRPRQPAICRSPQLGGSSRAPARPRGAGLLTPSDVTGGPRRGTCGTRCGTQEPQLRPNQNGLPDRGAQISEPLGAPANTPLNPDSGARWRGGLKVATWNVRTLGGNRPEVELYLKSADIAILAIQETHRLDGGWPLRIRG